MEPHTQVAAGGFVLDFNRGHNAIIPKFRSV